ncbi:uncharacterized protein FOMMEDRAFT_147792 [Fomitiporia mediterranea MF3/22]|uniref:uncharacterized protein n=1 Tax=Fomitiporia mediterranea (strain MF3/22) TaxID=694068 RepID=UPI0004409736|nr:uncharacterized protein FOMMEDRAFT_147792 [Fomitiporia mediterranea MF3/22]EJD01190.1 hypothetical protein FOMMEDRAFT_147792 [Fomitiporia mediterranea MF3/22]
MQSMLSAIAEQRQAQHNQLQNHLQQLHQHAQDLPYALAGQVQERGRAKQSKHRREGNTSWGAAWQQASDAGTSHSKRAGGVSWADAYGNASGADAAQQASNVNSWAGTGEGSGTTAKSKKKRAKAGEQQGKTQTNGWATEGGESSWNNNAWNSVPSGAAATSVTPGGFGSTSVGGWGANTAADGWGTHDAGAQASALDQSQSWGGWGEAQQETQKEKTPKKGISGFFSRMFKGRGKENKKGKAKEKGLPKDPWVEEAAAKVKKKEKKKEKDGWPGEEIANGKDFWAGDAIANGNDNAWPGVANGQTDAWAEEAMAKGRKDKEKHVHVQEQGKKRSLLKKQKFAEPEATAWPASEEDGDEDEYEDEWDDIGETNEWPMAANTGFGDSASAVPSKASDAWASALPGGSKVQTHHAEGQWSEAGRSRTETQIAEHRFVESNGEALEPADRAFFSKERLSRDRMFWFFDPHKDPRVFALLDWIERLKYPLAVFGFSKFLETKERGALFANADYRSPSAPLEPAFDWLTFDKVQATKDKILQESLAYYNPSAQILVFVFLLSPSKKSMAIWRRKLPLPDNIRLTYGTQITKMVASLNKPYHIRTDDEIERSASNKKRWLNWGR